MNTPVLWTASEVAAATGGDAGGGAWSATGVSIDSRTVREGDLFVALRGERFDGHGFVRDALEKGAAAALIARDADGLPAGPSCLRVHDTLRALIDLARAARTRTRGRIVAVTGSVGKTGVKEALAAALGRLGPTHASAGNLNNHIGAPLSLARMAPETAFAVFELGMNHAGEIAPLSRLVRPHLAIITTVTSAHREFFDSEEGIADAKAEIMEGLEAGAPMLLNRDNRHFARLEAAAGRLGLRVVPFGESPAAAHRLADFEASEGVSRVTARIGGAARRYTIAREGRHHAFNSLAVLGAMHELDLDVDEGAKALAELDPLPGRGARLTLAVPGGSVSVIDETYNASPAAMRAAIAVLAASMPDGFGRRVAVLGDMLELGETSAAEHAALAGPLSDARVDLVVTVGPRMRALDAALPLDKRAGSVDKTEAAIPILRDALRPGDVVLMKGSRGARLDQLIDSLSTPHPSPGLAAGGSN